MAAREYKINFVIFGGRGFGIGALVGEPWTRFPQLRAISTDLPEFFGAC